MDDLKLIKRHYGEKMSHLCRDLFPTLLETPGLLYEILSNKFYPSRYLYNDLIQDEEYVLIFKDMIHNEVFKKNRKEEVVDKTPQELLDEAGYTLYECKTEKDIQKFRKYYRRPNNEKLPEYEVGTEPKPYAGEELCTFNGNRLDRCHVFFAVKKNVDEIKREDFVGKEERQDEYGTSVLSIQFSKGNKNTLSIKNRYNHTVGNPDATFANNLDNIIPGLTKAFENEYGYEINGSNESDYGDLPGYVRASDGRYYKYNYEIENVYYCPDNIIIDHYEVKQYDKSRYLIIDYFIIDLKEKKIEQFVNYNTYGRIYRDPFINGLTFGIKNIKVEPNEETKGKKIIINDDIIIETDETNQIVSYKNSHLVTLHENFLGRIRNLKKIDLPNVTKIEDHCLTWVDELEELNLPKCKSIGSGCLRSNFGGPKELNLPEVETIGDSFLESATEIEKINLPKCEVIGGDFLHNSQKITEVDLPNAVLISYGFIGCNHIIKKLNIPKCQSIGSGFLSFNNELEEFDAPECEEIGACAIEYNRKLKRINLPKCKTIHDKFMHTNEEITVVNLPNIEQIGDKFLEDNKKIQQVNIPKCSYIGDAFLKNNLSLKEIDLPNVKQIGNGFLEKNNILKRITIPVCKTVGGNFLLANTELEKIDMSTIKKVASASLISAIRYPQFSGMLFRNSKVKVIINNKEYEMRGEYDEDEKGESNKSK